MQNRTDIHGKPNIELVWYSSRKRKEKGRLRENGQRIRTRTGIVQIARGLSSYTGLCTSHLAPHPSGGQPTPPPRHASTLLAPRPTLPGPQRSTLTRSLLGPCAAGEPFSVQQPCELHVWRTPVVIPKQLCLSIKCHSPRRPTPHFAAGLMPPS
jgi:hypothetical protein